MSLAVLQSGGTSTTAINSGSSGTILPANVTVGNAGAAAVYVSAGTPVVSGISSSIAATFTRPSAIANGTALTDIEWWVWTSATGAANSIIVTTSGSQSWAAAGFEVSGGPGGYIGSLTNSGTGTGPTETVSGRTSGDLVLVQVAGTSAITSAPSSPWSDFAGSGFYQWSFALDVAWQTVTSSSVTATWAQSSSGGWLTAGVVFTVGADYSSVVLGDSPVGFWELAEASGTTATDATGNSNGTYGSGLTLGEPGLPGGGGATSVLFGTSGPPTDTVEVPNVTANEIANVFTLEVWVKLAASISATSALMGVPVAAKPGIQLSTAGAFSLVVNNTSSVSVATTNITDTTKFHHVVATKNGSTTHLYLDGVDVTGTVTDYTFTTETGGFYIGSQGDNAHNAPSCYLAMAAVYNVALSPTQVLNHYNAGANITAPTVVSEQGSTFTPTVAAFGAWVNPNGADTTVSFNYGTTTGYGSSTGSVDIGSGTVPVWVSVTVTGLSSNTTYHFQAVAVNSVGTTDGADSVIATASVPTTSSGLLGQGLLGSGILGNGSGAAGHVGNATDTLSISDSVRTPSAPLHATDALVVTDAAHFKAQPAHATDTFSASDSARFSAQPSHVTDTLLVSDSARFATQPGHATDTLVATDQPRFSTQPTRATDSLSVSDSAQVHAVFTGSASDSLVVSDVAHAPGPGRSTDSLSVSDSARTATQPAHSTDSLSVSDSLRFATQPAHATDSLVVTSSARFATQPARTTDSLSATDAARFAAQPGHSTDSLSASDAARFAAQPAGATDALSVAGTARTPSAPLHATDALSITDSAAFQNWDVTATDALSVADTAHFAAQVSHSTDSLSVSDSARFATQPAHSTDALSTSDAATARGPLKANATDALSLADAAHFAAQPLRSTDSLSLTDSARFSGQPSHCTDSLSITGTARLKASPLNALDALFFTDAARFASQKAKSTDSLVITDLATQRRAALATDSLLITDSAVASVLRTRPGTVSIVNTPYGVAIANSAWLVDISLSAFTVAISNVPNSVSISNSPYSVAIEVSA